MCRHAGRRARTDSWFDPSGSGLATIELNRSVYHHGTGHDPAYPRQQLNHITHFIDGPNVYGSDEVRAAARASILVPLRSSTPALGPCG
jgi:hypothetical protein